MKNQGKHFLKFGFPIYFEQFPEEPRLRVRSTPFLI